jgi:hypothetical protein
MRLFAPIVAVGVLTALSAKADWVAGRDLKANELPDGNGVEQIDPNTTVPQWSYGYRGTLNSTALTLFTTAQHFNSFNGSSSVQGFTLGNGNDSLVNLGSSDVIYNFGHGNLNALHPGDMYVHPGVPAASAFEIVRWTAPASGTYTLTGSWRDLDPNGGNGAEAAITVNGVSIFDQTFANNGNTATNLTETLTTGDLVDFIIGPNGDPSFDATAFNATITAVPEPATWAIAALAALMLTVQIFRAAAFTGRNGSRG